jgi:hypothetical protein
VPSSEDLSTTRPARLRQRLAVLVVLSAILLGGSISSAAVSASAAVTTAASVHAGHTHAVTLVDAQGQPIGGQWQHWANEAHVPTLSGELTLILGSADPGCPVACSTAPGNIERLPDGSFFSSATLPTETWVVPHLATEWNLDWELGHQFDWRYLTDAQRAMFADLWHLDLPWWDSQTAAQNGREDGLEAVFAQDYADCATGAFDVINSWIPQPRLTAMAQLASTCTLIDQIGARDGANTPAAFTLMGRASGAVQGLRAVA